MTPVRKQPVPIATFRRPDVYAPECDLPKVDCIPLWKVAVFAAVALAVFTFACAVLP